MMSPSTLCLHPWLSFVLRDCTQSSILYYLDIVFLGEKTMAELHDSLSEGTGDLSTPNIQTW